MRITLGNDHCGLGLKDHVKEVLDRMGVEVTDVGTHTADPVDFPDITRLVCDPVRRGEADRGVLLCGTGVGACIAANKIPGIRAALCHDTFCAHQSVEHDDVNVLAMGAWIIGPVTAEEVLRSYLNATFSTEEHFRRRVDKLHRMELDGARELTTATADPHPPAPRSDA
ncbi:RpiB/LacA/LacB family sugar-phosphate isomerase [Streptomyces sp. DSM 42041]|uniref:RpiB/LacA/LacB family sugar-phosphate isomerase n=1 Tax=Streptomyces hazeniae TaxID=3075538 RepID=A0ABU2NKA6_9ACTN|nr:RpiB/LacA/LacB family sugar-phosphate isomerase [Streptomyces sp. DSM 42041]MDT0377412.1 RpiB/LacA/LacB family sugar-phosphate isomerase [Streptomyces sp. DSM 42041]